MEVLSVESCVRAVTDAYRDASRLVQRVKDRHRAAGDDLPEGPTKELDDSLTLGSLAVRNQYDYGVRRFGETFARGDALAREHMKDILIAFQQATVSHLREVYMDDAVLDLQSLKEASEDTRINATVCLGQLYQRLSTATAAVKQLSRAYTYPDEAETSPPSLLSGWSSGQSAQSYDKAGSLTSHSTIPGRITPATNSRKISGSEELVVRRNSLTSYSDDYDPHKTPTATEHGLHDQPYSITSRYRDVIPHTEPDKIDTSVDEHSFYTPDSPIFMPSEIPYILDMQQPCVSPMGSIAPLSPPLEPTRSPSHERPNREHRPRLRSPQNRSPSESSAPNEIHEVTREERTPATNDARQRELPKSSIPARKPAPIAAIPIYTTYGPVANIEPSNGPSSSVLVQQGHQPHQWYYQPSQHQRQEAHYHQEHPYQARPNRQEWPEPQQPQKNTAYSFRSHRWSSRADISTPPTSPRSSEGTGSSQPTSPRPMSIRSLNSISSKFTSTNMRKVLPPGLAEVVKHSGSASSVHGSIHGSAYDSVHGHRQGGAPHHKATVPSIRSETPQPQMQVPPSLLNIPSESNLSGLCKGAIRVQPESRKKGFSFEHRNSATSAGPPGDYWKCTKCAFSGPAITSLQLPSGGRGAPKREKLFDSRVRVSEGGIRYRWIFLARSHHPVKTLPATTTSQFHSSKAKDNVPGIFGCVFCLAEGAARGWKPVGDENARLKTGVSIEGKKAARESLDAPHPMPMFSDLRSFMAHLEMHRAPSGMPGLIMAEKMNCIVGRKASDSEEFDLNLPPL